MRATGVALRRRDLALPPRRRGAGDQPRRPTSPTVWRAPPRWYRWTSTCVATSPSSPTVTPAGRC
ncbi:hypothetical protein FTX61_07630 [Nitriliruptoraceae bacterium ZYF776]|nr:hypothetical protein [Profundirhabdus halotolerans]